MSLVQHVPMTGPTSAPTTVSSRIHRDLRAAILDGRYVVGEALPSERRLCDEFEVSRHAVREALKRLQQAGLVSISQGGATRVRDWRRHGGLELLLDLAQGDAPEALHVPRAAMEMRASVGADAARRCAERADAVLRAQLNARVEQFAAVEDREARNAHYEVLWDLVVEGADNLAYRLALTSLLRQRAASVQANAVAREIGDVPAVRALVGAIAAGEADTAFISARDLLERSIPRG
jgi:DNA-binding FadR family transcriptional regulator